MENEKSKNEARYMEVVKTLGIDPIGKQIDKEPAYSLLFERIKQKVPTSNHHC